MSAHKPTVQVRGAVDGNSLPVFGDLLRRHRGASGLTQEELAERAGVSVRAIGDLERGVSATPHRDTVGLLANALELTGDRRDAFEASARRRPPTAAPTRAQVPPLADVWGRLNPPLAGRALEMDLVRSHLTGDGPPTLLLAGEPGIGKSRLLAEASRAAIDSGWSVLDSGCQRRGSQEPFAPLVGALATFLRRRSHAEARRLLRGCSWLVRLLPELAPTIGEALPAWTLAADQERRLMFEAVARLLGNVVQLDISEPGAGVLLVLDDLQWAGSDTFDLLGALMGPTSPGTQPADQPRLRILGAYRDTEVQPQDVLGIALADWAHANLVTHHSLAPLESDACELLLEQLLTDDASPPAMSSGDRALRQRVLQRAGGVPFFVVSYAHALSRGNVRSEAEAVPWDVTQGVRQRVARLGDAAVALLSAAAVIGRECDLAVLLAVVGRPEDEVLAGLDAACRARLLIDRGQSYQFAHDVILEVVEADMSAARRAVLHRQVGAAIETLYSDALSDRYETLAHHFLRGNAWQQALQYLERSGDKATSAGAIGEALKHYDQALAVCEQLGAPARATASAVAEKRGFVCFDSGHFQGGVADFARMRTAAAQMGDRRREGLALAYGGMAAYYGHEFDIAENTLREALQIANGAFDDTRLFASVQLSSLFMITGRHTEAAPLLSTAEALAPRVEDSLSRSWWAITGSEVLHWSGRYAAALALLEQWQAAVTISNQLLMHLWTRWEAALAHGGAGDYTRALHLLDEVISICADTGESFIRARALNTAGWLHCELQNHQRALQLNGESLALADAIETADTEIRSNARLNLGDSYFASGRLTEAEAHFQAVEHVVRNPRPQDRWMLWRYSQHLFHSFGALRLACGDTDAAAAYADECLRGAEATDSPKNIVKARRLRGEVFMARGDLPAAAAELEVALDLARRIGNPPQLWRTLGAIGELHRAEDADVDARRAFRQALSVIETVASDLEDVRLREAFLSSAHVAHIRQLAEATVRSTASQSV